MTITDEQRKRWREDYAHQPSTAPVPALLAALAACEMECDELLRVTRHCPSCEFTYAHEGTGPDYAVTLEAERDSLKAKLAEAEKERDWWKAQQKLAEHTSKCAAAYLALDKLLGGGR